ncbi:dafc30d7-e8c9-40f9-8dbc-c6a7c30fb895 [Sclerotinia trifoliorum]|uniref:Dafc30d7-e8c9-40f9-8dbc-c6a7c30fb895 n=1 Tax=Sclerotinia trifoliorum TaxID=28548 RepID=A0A8H2ZLP6_9HELO|nr:dafc30d7-e8c9-40f9-8dbc-c6a7c30fb895 [Sclerotinia trifoliorum]
MVTPGYYSEQEPTFRRCGPRGQSYPLAQERSEHSYPTRNYNDGRNSDHGPENGETGHHQMRRRIQVACQRCRKRKIRCSGEENGRPCYHCKNSSSEPCVFLRVTAMPLEQAKDLPSDCFDDNSRSMYRVSSNTPYNYYQTSQTFNLGPDNINYRQTNYSNYGYQGTKFLGLSYDNFTEEPADFNLSNSTSFQVTGQDPVSVSSYPAQNNGRSRVNPPAPLYMDSEAATNYNQNAYQSYNARSMVDSDSKNFCVTNPACLPSYGTVNAAVTPQTALNTTNDPRQLPYPGINRQYRSANDGNSSAQSSLHPYGFVNSNMDGSGKMNGTSIQMPMTNSYMGVPTSSSHEITTAVAMSAYQSGQQPSMAQQDSEIYEAPTPNSSLYYSQSSDSAADINHYGAGSGNDASKSRQNSQTNTTEDTWPANNRKSSSGGNSILLASGQSYIPHTSSHYPTPNIPTQMQNHGLLQLPPQVQHDDLPTSREYVSNLSTR